MINFDYFKKPCQEKSYHYPCVDWEWTWLEFSRVLTSLLDAIFSEYFLMFQTPEHHYIEKKKILKRIIKSGNARSNWVVPAFINVYLIFTLKTRYIYFNFRCDCRLQLHKCFIRETNLSNNDAIDWKLHITHKANRTFTNEKWLNGRGGQTWRSWLLHYPSDDNGEFY